MCQAAWAKLRSYPESIVEEPRIDPLQTRQHRNSSKCARNTYQVLTTLFSFRLRFIFVLSRCHTQSLALGQRAAARPSPHSRSLTRSVECAAAGCARTPAHTSWSVKIESGEVGVLALQSG